MARTSLATWRRELDLDRLEDQYQLPRGLMSNVLRHESGGDPNATSKAGAGGLFQLMPETAAAYKADPYDPHQAAPAAAQELGAHWRRYGGDLPRTLAAWNWGSGNLQKKGLAQAPTETRNFIRNVSSGVGEGYAQAGDTVTDMPRYQGPKTTAGQTGQARRSPLDDILKTLPDAPPDMAPARPQAGPAVQTPTVGPTTATRFTGTLDDILKTLPDAPPDMPPAATPPAPAPAPVQAPPTPPPPAALTQQPAVEPFGPQGAPQRVDPGQFMAQQAPAAVQAMQPPPYVPSGLPPEQQPLSERLAAHEAGQNPNAPPPPSLPEQGAAAVRQGAQEFDPLWGPKALYRGLQDPYWLRKGVAKGIEMGADVATGSAAAAGGFALGGVGGMIAGPVIAQGALDRARMQLGLKPQEKAVFETGVIDVYQADLFNAGLGLFTGAPDILRGVLGKSQAGKAITKAKNETKAAYDAWQTAEDARKEAFAKGQTRAKSDYEDITIAEKKATYDAKVRERNALVAKHQETFDLATREYQLQKMKRDAEVQDVDAANYYNTQRFQEEQAAYPDVRAKQVAQAEAEAREKAAETVRKREAGYEEKVGQAAAQAQAHQEALERAQMLPEMYKKSGDAAEIKYQRLRDEGKDELVSPDAMAPGKTVTPREDIQQFLDEDYKQYLDETTADLPPQVKFHADKLLKLPAGKPVSVLAVHDTMKALGPLTNSPNGDIRRTASVLYGALSDMLEQHPKIAGLARDASQTFKREKAVKELGTWTGVGDKGSLVTRAPRGEGYQLDVKGLLNRFDRAQKNKLFRGAFDDDEWAALTKDMEEFRGTPGLPRPVTPLTREQRTIAPAEATIPADKPPEMPEVLPYPKALGPEPVLKDPGKPIGPFAPRPFEETKVGRRPFEETTPPKEIEAQLATTPKSFFKSVLGQGSSIGGMAYMLSRAGLAPAAVDNLIYLGLGSLAAGAAGTTMDYAVSKALMTPKGRTMLKSAMGPGGRLDPNFFGAYVVTLSDTELAEFKRGMPKESEPKKARR